MASGDDVTAARAVPRTLVASYCTTFLKREMLHIYRQVTGLRRFSTFVLTKERKNAALFPFPDIELLPPPRIHPLAHLWGKYIQRFEPLIYRGESAVLAAVLARRRPDLLHIYFGHTGVHLLPFLRQRTIPALVSFHGMDVQLRPEHRRYEARLRELLAIVPMVLARSESLAACLTQLGCAPSKIRINRTGIPLEHFPFCQRQPPPDGAWILVQACRFIEKKGLTDTLAAFAEFHRRHPRARLVLAGQGPLENELRRLAASHTLPVQFPGFLQGPELTRLYHSAHLFLHPSITTPSGDREGIPNAMLEAMATGLPVVATLHGGIPEAVQDGVTGLLVPERSPQALAAALETFASQPAFFTQASASASAAVREKFDLRKTCALLESFYDELLEAHAPPHRPPKA